jgi:hypothetical protein
MVDMRRVQVHLGPSVFTTIGFGHNDWFSGIDHEGEYYQSPMVGVALNSQSGGVLKGEV